jgi:hypothetical protein
MPACAATRRRCALTAALEERDVTLAVLLDDGGSGIGAMGLSVGQQLALERAVRRCQVSDVCVCVGGGGSLLLAGA